jgi:hypothetical protein
MDKMEEGAIEQWHSILFVSIPPDVISHELCTPKAVAA